MNTGCGLFDVMWDREDSRTSDAQKQRSTEISRRNMLERLERQEQIDRQEEEFFKKFRETHPEE